MTEYVVSWLLRGTSIVEAESEAAARRRVSLAEKEAL